MAKATPATEGKSPKKRTVKAKAAPENGAEVVETAVSYDRYHEGSEVTRLSRREGSRSRIRVVPATRRPRWLSGAGLAPGSLGDPEPVCRLRQSDGL